ncbi:MAG TPA: glutaredoxin family protein [Gaiella sp.]|jgi:hypothetical protein|nr:glutaredoxin family protein [Gaiella sp.]
MKGTPRVRLYVADGCHLCGVAVEVVRTVCGGDFELVDITGDPDLERRYRAVIPLVEIDGEERFRFEVDEEDLRALL